MALLGEQWGRAIAPSLFLVHIPALRYRVFTSNVENTTVYIATNHPPSLPSPTFIETVNLFVRRGVPVLLFLLTLTTVYVQTITIYVGGIFAPRYYGVSLYANVASC